MAEPARPVGERGAVLLAMHGAHPARRFLQRDRMHHRQQPAHHGDRIDAQAVLRIEIGEHRIGIARDQMREQPPHRAAIGQAQHAAHLFGANLRRAFAGIAPQIGMRDRLIEDRQAVAHRSFRGIGDHRERIGLGGDRFLDADLSKMAGEQFGRNALQVEALAARQHRDRHLVHLGRGEQELHVRRRFLQRLEQAVPCLFGEHVRFVDDVHLVARGDSGIAHSLGYLANVVDAGMAGGVHLNHVDMAPLGNRDAGFTHAARRNRGAALPIGADAVQRLGDQPRGRGLAHPAHPGHEERMRQPLAPDRVAQRLHHGVLADQLGKGLRAVFARKHAIGLARSASGRGNGGQIEPEPGHFACVIVDILGPGIVHRC